MADGMWTMNEQGEFHLEEPYRTWLQEAKEAATRGWHAALVEYLVPRCPYTAQELTDELVRRNEARSDHCLRVAFARIGGCLLATV